ncbi:MAG: HPr family phosphocarrier protein [Desulfovibrio sp.]|jgi:phosphocarrier protein|nr:HPr family phosphocarrier protein [Desulfovibrio sp.]
MEYGVSRAEEGQEVSVTVFVRDELGMHARPAARLAQAARRYRSRIILEYEDMTADAKSVLDILFLAAGRGAPLTLRCAGEDAREAAEVLEALFNEE